MSDSRGPTVVFLVPDGVHPLDLTGPAQVFYEAVGLGASFELVFAGIEDRASMPSSMGLQFGGLQPWSALTLTDRDIIFLPGAEMDKLRRYTREGFPEFYRWLQEQDQNGVCLASVCTGAYFLGVAGLLCGISYTTHWRYHDYFKEQFPGGKLLGNRFFVSEGNRISSAGISSGIDLSLHLLEAHCGSKLAAEVARECVLYLRRGPSDPQLSVFMAYRNHIDDRVHRVQDYISEHLDQPLQIADLAELAFTSPRNLTRRFKQLTGITIGAYIERLRVERALQLLDKGHGMASITAMCGLKNESHLRALIKRHRP